MGLTPVHGKDLRLLDNMLRRCHLPRERSALVNTLIGLVTVIGCAAIVALEIPSSGVVTVLIGASRASRCPTMLLPCPSYLRINKAAQSFGVELVAVAIGIVID